MQCCLFDQIFYAREGLFIERRMCDYSAQNIVKHNLFAHLMSVSAPRNSSFEDN